MTTTRRMTETRPSTTTRRDLLRLAFALVVLSVLTAVCALAAFDSAQRAADTVRADTVPAVVEVSAAQGALVAADLAAVTSFSTGAVRLSGPGDEYRDQIAIANQHLTRAAAHDIGDGSAPQRLELVNALLAAYSSSIEQAAASFRHNENTPLWSSDLWTASRLLHADGGALAQLDGLRDTQIGKLDSEVDAGANTVLASLTWLVPGIALLGLLIVAQLCYLRRRFHRLINPGLAAATLCVLGMLAVACLTFDIGSRLDTTRDTVQELKDTWHGQASARGTLAQQRLADLIDTRCPAQAGECGSTVEGVVEDVRARGPIDAETIQDTVIDGTSSVDVDAAAAAATRHGGYGVLIPLTAAAAIALIAVGIQARIVEYRYRSK
jgi:hypothetical protein